MSDEPPRQPLPVRGAHQRRDYERENVVAGSRRLNFALMAAFLLGFGEGGAAALFFTHHTAAAKLLMSATTFTAIVVTVLIWSRSRRRS